MEKAKKNMAFASKMNKADPGKPKIVSSVLKNFLFAFHCAE
jgi:hypothetical protein